MKTIQEIEEKLRRVEVLLSSDKEGVHIHSTLKNKLNNQREILEWILK